MSKPKEKGTDRPDIPALTITQPDPPVGVEILAEAIVRMGKAVERLQHDGGLNERALVVLIQDYAPELSKKQIKTVFGALPRLREMYCR